MFMYMLGVILVLSSYILVQIVFFLCIKSHITVDIPYIVT